MLNKINYNAGREKIFAVALAMELSIEEVNELLKVAGIQFKPNDKFEVAINFCFDHGYYDIDDIAEFLEETKWGKLWKD